MSKGYAALFKQVQEQDAPKRNRRIKSDVWKDKQMGCI
jgi:hypothetical protein